MCGIAGFQGGFDAGLLDAMTASIAHRGPDGEGTALLGQGERVPTGFGHRRLAIIDLTSDGRQPMTVDCPACGAHGLEDLALTYNGEIYNFRELRDELRRDGHVFHSRSDSEVLLHRYAALGIDMVNGLNGIFAFAIRDGRELRRPSGVDRGDLFLARDHMGVKPLYVAETPRGFLFASELKALLADATLSREIDPISLHHTLAYLWSPAPRTMLRGVRKVEPGEALLVRDGKIRRKWSFFRMPYDGVTTDQSRDEIAVELAERVRTAVERQLVADVPVGAFLSGGLDSSAIVTMMRKARPRDRITAFSIGFRGAGDVEGNPPDLPYARRVARQYDIDLQEIEIDPSAIARLPELVALLDEPQADPAPINALMIAERARELSIPVLLSGAGGDDLFSGYRRHWALRFERRWAWLPQAVRAGIQRVATRAGSARRSQLGSGRRRFAKMFAHAAADGDTRLVGYFEWSSDAVRRSLYSAAFAAEVASCDVAAPLLASLTDIPSERDPLQRMLYLEARHFLADHNLNYTDRAGMAVGVEVRVPLLDLDVVTLAARIPSRYKQAGRVGKAIFKRAMEPYLPRDIVYRPKSGFGVPLRRWLRNELRPMVEETLDESSLRRRGIFDAGAVRRLIDLNAEGRVDGAYTIFALVCIELWCRQFIDATHAMPASHGPIVALAPQTT